MKKTIWDTILKVVIAVASALAGIWRTSFNGLINILK